MDLGPVGRGSRRAAVGFSPKSGGEPPHSTRFAISETRPVRAPRLETTAWLAGTLGPPPSGITGRRTAGHDVAD